MFRASVERCESLNTELYDYTEAECTIQEIYFSECRVGTTMRMLLESKTIEKKIIKTNKKNKQTFTTTEYRNTFYGTENKGKNCFLFWQIVISIMVLLQRRRRFEVSERNWDPITNINSNKQILQLQLQLFPFPEYDLKHMQT